MDDDTRNTDFLIEDIIRDGTNNNEDDSHDTDAYLNLENEDAGGAPNLEDIGALDNANEDTNAPADVVNLFVKCN